MASGAKSIGRRQRPDDTITPTENSRRAPRTRLAVVDVGIPCADAWRSANAARQQRLSEAGGELLGAAFKFLGALVSQHDASPAPDALVANLKTGLEACIEQDPTGKPRLTVTLPDQGALDGLAQALTKLLTAGGGQVPASRKAPLRTRPPNEN